MIKELPKDEIIQESINKSEPISITRKKNKPKNYYKHYIHWDRNAKPTKGPYKKEQHNEETTTEENNKGHSSTVPCLKADPVKGQAVYWHEKDTTG